jgi:hypothetical protein
MALTAHFLCVSVNGRFHEQSHAYFHADRSHTLGVQYHSAQGGASLEFFIDLTLRKLLFTRAVRCAPAPRGFHGCADLQ